jgi:hypothetical protein
MVDRVSAVVLHIAYAFVRLSVLLPSPTHSFRHEIEMARAVLDVSGSSGATRLQVDRRRSEINVTRPNSSHSSEGRAVVKRMSTAGHPRHLGDLWGMDHASESASSILEDVSKTTMEFKSKTTIARSMAVSFTQIKANLGPKVALISVTVLLCCLCVMLGRICSRMKHSKSSRTTTNLFQASASEKFPLDEVEFEHVSLANGSATTLAWYFSHTIKCLVTKSDGFGVTKGMKSG